MTDTATQISHRQDAAPRMGLFGGAFDPPHNAHLALAQQALVQLDLQQLLVLPTGQAWHKNRPPGAAADRLAMTQLAFAHMARVAVDDRELRRQGPTYTIDTLRQLQQEYGNAQWFVVMGADQAEKLPLWHRWEELVHSAIIAVAVRPGHHSARNLHPLVVSRMVQLHIAAMDISATDIRRRVAAGQDTGEQLPAAVARYIAQHCLYQQPHEKTIQA